MLELMDRPIAANTMTDLAAIHVRNGCLRDAISCYENALVAMREEGDRDGEAQTLRRLDAVHELVTDQDAAAPSNARTAS